MRAEEQVLFSYRQRYLVAVGKVKKIMEYRFFGRDRTKPVPPAIRSLDQLGVGDDFKQGGAPFDHSGFSCCSIVTPRNILA